MTATGAPGKRDELFTLTSVRHFASFLSTQAPAVQTRLGERRRHDDELGPLEGGLAASATPGSGAASLATRIGVASKARA